MIPTILLAIAVMAAAARAESGLDGRWRLNVARSQVRGLPAAPDLFLRVEQRGQALLVTGSSQEDGPGTSWTYPLDGTEARRQTGKVIQNSTTKWEGTTLLVNTLVSGPENYSVAERWRRSRDGNTLTIRRVVNRMGSEAESTLVYENLAAPPAPVPAPSAAPPAREEREITSARPAARSEEAGEYVVAAGTRILLRLTSAVNTKHTKPGDRIYLETAVPVFVNGRLVIPHGSYVAGTVTESKEAGRVKGRSALNLHFDSLTLPSGVARDFRSRAGSVETRGDLDRKEGRIEGEGNKAGDAGTIGRTTAAGAGIGTVAGAASGHWGMGTGIGAAAGAAAGLAGVLGSRGPQVQLPPGTTMEMVLDRDLRYSAAELSAR